MSLAHARILAALLSVTLTGTFIACSGDEGGLSEDGGASGDGDAGQLGDGDGDSQTDGGSPGDGDNSASGGAGSGGATGSGGISDSSTGGSNTGAGGGSPTGVCFDQSCAGDCAPVDENDPSCGGQWECRQTLICTDDLASFCGCDGKTFTGSSSCKSFAYAYAGPCEEGIEGGKNCDGNQVMTDGPTPQCEYGFLPEVINGTWGECIPMEECGCEVSGSQAQCGEHVCHSNNRCGVLSK